MNGAYSCILHVEIILSFAQINPSFAKRWIVWKSVKWNVFFFLAMAIMIIATKHSTYHHLCCLLSTDWNVKRSPNSLQNSMSEWTSCHLLSWVPSDVTAWENTKLVLSRTHLTFLPSWVNLYNRSASTFQLKTIEIATKHIFLCSSINKWLRKTLITTQQARGTRWETGVMCGENQSPLKPLTI